MSRKPRLFSPELAYHVIVRGNNKQTLFRNPSDYQQYLYYLERLKTQFEFAIYHYCLMDNHVHLLIKFPSLVEFRQVPHRLGLLYAKYFSRLYNHVGHVFQGRFKSIPVSDNTYLLECGRYIERNPLKAHLVSHPNMYEWCSYSFYGVGKENNLITVNPLYLDLGADSKTRQAIYEAYVLTHRAYEAGIEKTLFGRNAV